MKASRIEIRVSEEDKKIIKEYADKENLQVATFIRKVVLDYINKNE